MARNVTFPPPPPPSAAPAPSAAWLNVAAKVSGAGVSFLLYIAMARTMTPEGFADVAVALAWVALASSVLCLSAPLVLVRYVPAGLAEGRPGLALGVIRFMFGVTAVLATAVGVVAVAAILAGLFELPRDAFATALIAAALLPPSVVLVGLSGLLTGLKRAAVAEIVVNVVRPALMVAGIVALWLAHREAVPAPIALGIYLAASLVMTGVGVAYARSVAPPELSAARPQYAVREWTRAAAGFMGVVVAVSINERIDLLLMSVLAPAADVAAYAVAARFAQTIVVAATAANAVMAPHLVERLGDLRRGHLEELQPLVTGTARTAFYVCLLALAGFAILGPLFLRLFGPQYARAYEPLVILALGQGVAGLFGPAAAVATLAGRAPIAIGTFGAGIAVNAALNVALVPRLGADGAAIATATGTICAAVLAWVLTRRRLGLDTAAFARRGHRPVC